MGLVDEVFPHIKTIHDLGETLSHTNEPSHDFVSITLGSWSIRSAARVILTHGDNIAMQTIPHRRVNKVPGGGIQSGESKLAGVERELAEEVGLTAGVLKPLGAVIEYRRHWKLLQVSYCYYGEIDSPVQTCTPTEEGSELLWARGPDEALSLLKECEGLPENAYDRQFASARDISVVEFFAENIAGR